MARSVRIVAIEDEYASSKIPVDDLRRAGQDVVLARSGREGIEAARERATDLIMLDLVLPDMAGTEACRALQQIPETKRVPIMIVTAKGDETDRIVGFELGAMDYVVKPFSVRELLLRVQAVLRRAQGVGVATRPTLELGCLRVDEQAHRAWVDGREVPLTPLEFRLLLALLHNCERVQTRSALQHTVWGMDGGAMSRTVDTHVKRLRDKLGRAGDGIETVRGIGYRFSTRPEGERPRSDPPSQPDGIDMHMEAFRAGHKAAT